jgi:hypothetical protein
MVHYVAVFFLFVAGIGLTLTSAYFGISGFLDFFPTKEYFYGIMALGVFLEFGKVSSSIFLFHHGRDKGFPLLLRLWMSVGIMFCIVLSMLFTYAHLSVPIAMAGSAEAKQESHEVFLKEKVNAIQAEKDALEGQIADLPEEYARARRDLYDKYRPRLDILDERKIAAQEVLEAYLVKSMGTSEKGTNDIFSFVKYISNVFGFTDYKVFYSLIIIILVLFVDPLAIILTLAATYMMTLKKEVIEEQITVPSSFSIKEETNTTLEEDVKLTEEIIDETKKTHERVLHVVSHEETIVEEDVQPQTSNRSLKDAAIVSSFGKVDPAVKTDSRTKDDGAVSVHNEDSDKSLHEVRHLRKLKVKEETTTRGITTDDGSVPEGFVETQVNESQQSVLSKVQRTASFIEPKM